MVSARRILSDLSLFRREYLRSRTGFFFSLVFPVVLILIFGAVFSGGSSGPVTVYAQSLDHGVNFPVVGNVNVSTIFVGVLNSTNVMKITLLPNNETLSQYLLTHSGAVGILIPSNFTYDYTHKPPIPVNVTVYTNPADTSAQIVLSVTNGIVNGFNLHAANASAIVGIQQQTVAQQSNPKYIDFLIPGLIGFAILISPMFSMVAISADYKKTKLFKQLSLTPLTKGEWLISKIIWYIALSLISFVLMTAVGVYVFGGTVTLSLWILPFLLLGPLFFVALGMLVGSISKSVESAAVIGNIITFPMMFLSGTFFPLSIMPKYLQVVAHVFPLYYLIDGLNAVMVYSNYSSALIDVVVLLVLSAIVFVAAIRVFKWRED
jgi:ABC-2 type transport system permease protein